MQDCGVQQCKANGFEPVDLKRLRNEAHKRVEV